MKILNLTLIILVCGIFSACLIGDFTVIRGNGEIITVEKTMSSFEKIDCSSSADIRFHISDEFRTVLTVDSNLEEYVEIFTQNNKLVIKTSWGNYSFTKFLVDVYAPDLTGITISGSGDFISNDKLCPSSFDAVLSGSGSIKSELECNNFSVVISGSGKISINGSTDDAIIDISGSGRFNGNDFIIKKAFITISGSGIVYTHVSDSLHATISGSGSIYYKGDPKVSKIITGSGHISRE